jgi:putative DNA primase/helicase
VEYDPQATCPRFDAFLHRITGGDEDLIAYLQRAVGYSLTGPVSEDCVFILLGKGRNGKSVFLGVIERLLGDYAKATRPKTFMTKRSEIPNDVAALAQARFVPTVETARDKAFAENLVKQLTGDDTVTARFLYREFFNFRPSFKISIATNYQPTIRGTDHAIWEPHAFDSLHGDHSSTQAG